MGTSRQAVIVRNLATLAFIAADIGVAGACPAAVKLVGDDDLVAAVAGALHARGIATELPACAAITARVERRDSAIAISIDSTQPIEREVREIETAATVIESFTRDDAAPLLAVREVARPAPPVAATVEATPIERKPRGLHLFAGLESALASDSSRWLGLQLGGCWMIDMVCLAVRVRTSSRVDADDMEVRRQSSEALVGVDVPFGRRGWLVTPGIAFGWSSMVTRGADNEATNGLRADAHVTVSIPVAARFAVDVQLAANLLQPIHFDEKSENMLPSEPWGFARLGVGLRYGAR